MGKTMELFRSRFSYDPDMGVLTWVAAPKFNRWGIKVGDAVGRVNSHGYVEVRALGKSYQAHRIAWALFYGLHPAGEIDHINGNPADNRISNLRDVSPRINNRNKALSVKNTTGVMGVTRVQGGYRLQLRHAGKPKYIGTYPTIDEARVASRKAYLEHGYHENHGLAPAVRAGRPL